MDKTKVYIEVRGGTIVFMCANKATEIYIIDHDWEEGTHVSKGKSDAVGSIDFLYEKEPNILKQIKELDNDNN